MIKVAPAVEYDPNLDLFTLTVEYDGENEELVYSTRAEAEGAQRLYVEEGAGIL